LLSGVGKTHNRGVLRGSHIIYVINPTNLAGTAVANATSNSRTVVSGCNFPNMEFFLIFLIIQIPNAQKNSQKNAC
jgi:hypothetical protein